MANLNRLLGYSCLYESIEILNLNNVDCFVNMFHTNHSLKTAVNVVIIVVQFPCAFFFYKTIFCKSIETFY